MRESRFRHERVSRRQSRVDDRQSRDMPSHLLLVVELHRWIQNQVRVSGDARHGGKATFGQRGGIGPKKDGCDCFVFKEKVSPRCCIWGYADKTRASDRSLRTSRVAEPGAKASLFRKVPNLPRLTIIFSTMPLVSPSRSPSFELSGSILLVSILGSCVSTCGHQAGALERCLKATCVE